MKKKLVTSFLCFVMVFLLDYSSFAEEIVSQKNGLDVMFVIDSSGSMKSNDRNGIALEMVKAFIDTVHIENIRIGFTAYNDKIVSSTSPVTVSTQNDRENLKTSLSSIVYSGNTDIGLGLSYAYSLMSPEENRNRIVVLISDGETDLPKQDNGRNLEQSNQDLINTISQCQSEDIPIYTIAFGRYEGSQTSLQQISSDTGAETYIVESPESLIKVFYGIFGNNLSYKIQEVTNSVYAKGEQEIRYLLDEKYLDELDFLVISPQAIGETSISYGDSAIDTTRLNYYAVGKLNGIDPNMNEIRVKTNTSEGQILKSYLISYRNIVPVFEITTAAGRNQSIPYRVYFRDGSGNMISDESFYEKFQWELQGVTDFDFQIKDGIIQGELIFPVSGIYPIQGKLSDNLGLYQFATELTVMNTPPSGNLPEENYTILSPETTIDLGGYFQDKDGDSLSFSMDKGLEEYAQISLDGNQLTMKPMKSGIHHITLFVSDGEDTLSYPHQIRIVPIWKMYWWVLAIIAAIAFAIIWRALHKPKPELVQIVEKKAQCRFSGKMDAYFTQQPEEKEEIPPLTFPMYKMKTNKVSLGELMSGYAEASDALGLDAVYLIADEERRMVLYHTSDSLIMIGNSIVCRQIQYSVGFGDVIYVSSPKGTYELEVHYIAMIQ